MPAPGDTINNNPASNGGVLPENDSLNLPLESPNSIDAALDAAGVFDAKTTVNDPTAEPLNDAALVKKAGETVEAPKPQQEPAAPQQPATEKVETKKEIGSLENLIPSVTIPKGDEPAKAVEQPKPVEKNELEEIQEPKNLRPKDQNNWKRLRTSADTYRNEAITTRNELAKLKFELEQFKNNQSVPDNVKQEIEQTKKELEELRQFRYMYDLENAPEFKNAFDAKIDAAKNQSVDVLEQAGLAKETVDHIRKNGGIFEAKMPATQDYPNDAGKPIIKSQWFKEQVLDKMAPDDYLKFQNSLSETLKLQNDRETVKKQVYQQREQFEQVQRQQVEQRQQQVMQFAQQHVNELREQYPWSKPVEIPKDATPEQAKIITEHNEYITKRLEPIFEQSFTQSMNDPAIRTQSAAAAAGFFYLMEREIPNLRGQVDRYKQRAESLETELAAMKRVGSTAQLARVAPIAKSNRTNNTGDLLRMKDDDAFEAQWSAANG